MTLGEATNLTLMPRIQDLRLGFSHPSPFMMNIHV
jgi:hypothetical protein